MAVWVGLALAVTVLATEQALGTLNDPFAGFLVDAWARVSDVSAPSWNLDQSGLKYPDHVRAVNGVALPAPPREVAPSRAFYAELRRAAEAGQSNIVLDVETRDGVRRMERRLLRVPGAMVAFFFGVYALTGLFLLSTGVVVLWLSAYRAPALAFGAWAASAHLIFTSFFDYHTSTAITPVFPLGVMGFQASLLWLALSFPSPPAWAGRKTFGAMIALTVVLLGIGAAIGFAPQLGWDPTPLQGPASLGLFAFSVLLLLSVLARFRGAAAPERAPLRTVLLGLGVAPATMGALFLAMTLTGNSLFHLAAPFLFIVVPVSVGYALVQHDIGGASQVLTWRLLALPTTLLTAVLAATLGLGFGYLMLKLPSGALPALVAGAAFVLGARASRSSVRRWLFPAAAHFRPTIEHLADQLASPDAQGDVPTGARGGVQSGVQSAVQRAVERWLPASPVRLVAPEALGSIELAPPDAHVRLNAGERIWSLHPERQRHLILPMRSLGTLRGAIVVPPKQGGALFTEEDLALFDTIATLAAMSLHNADILAQADTLRRLEVELSRAEKTLALGLMGAQIAHEIAHPVNFFRGLVDEVDRGRLPSSDDVLTAREELDRLGRMLTSLRRLERPSLNLRPLQLRASVRRVADILREQLGRSEAVLQIDVADEIIVTADPDPLVQLLANLVKNGIEHCEPGRRVGVTVRDEAEAVVMDVWNSGKPIPESLRPHLFKPWLTTRREGTGLGLNIAVDLVGRLRWHIEHHREQEKTIFRITIPKRLP
jgi:signal transduction histidine kinase